MKKSWKLILIALLAALLVCTCMSAIAEEAAPGHGQPGYHDDTDHEVNVGLRSPVIVRHHDSCLPSQYQGRWGGIATYRYEKYCTICGYSLGEYEYKEEFEECWWGEAKIVEPTCTETGSSTYSCIWCGKTVTDTIPANGHMPRQDWNIVKDSTCYSLGWRENVCDVCGVIYGENIPMKKHNLGVVVVSPATCTKNEVCQNGCVNPGCSYRTGDTWETPNSKLPHKVVDHALVNATCETAGMKAYSECTVCGQILSGKKEVIPALGHIYNGVKTRVQEATCQQDGLYVYGCSRPHEQCNKHGDYWGQLVNEGKVGHLHPETGWEIDLEPDCMHVGYRVNRCVWCHGDPIKEELPIVEHKFTTWIKDKDQKAATCTTDGYKVLYCDYNCGTTTTVTIPATGHKAETNWRYDRPYPDCENDMHAWVQCAVCGKHLKEVTIPKIDHTWEKIVADPQANVEPTCTENGLYTYRCNNFFDQVNLTFTDPATGKPITYVIPAHGCGEIKTEVVPAKGHDYKVETTPATCTKAGKEVKTCKVCGDVVTTEIPALGHDYKTETVAPTCTKAGSETITCTRCGDVKSSKTIAALGHTAGEAEVTKAATCTEKGVKITKCAVCGETLKTEEIPALGHKEGTAEVTKAATCTEKGVKTTKCTVCGTTLKTEEIPALGHKAGEPIVTAATCTKAGSKVTKCSVCGETLKTEEIPALGHKAGEAEVTKAATCTEKGEKTTKCTVCGEVIKTEAIPALGHKAGEPIVTAATCTKAGSKVTKCSVCGETLKTEEIPALGHKEVVTETAATCTKAGSKVTKCSVCGETLKTEEIPALGHKEEVTETAATCTEAGSKVTKCSVCGETLKTEEIPALGHKEEVTETAATCTEAGSKVTKCSVCGETLKTEEIAALGHKAGEPVVTAATCTVAGSEVTSCTVCGEVIETKEIPAAGHVPGKEKIEQNKGNTYCTVCGELLSSRNIPSSSGSTGSTGSSTPAASAPAATIYSGVINAAGIAASELGGNGGSLVTPIDLSADGVYTYSLVAGDKYVVGTMIVTVSGGKATVSYSVKGGVTISGESLYIFANGEALKAGTATPASFNAAIDAAGDTKIILAVNLIGSFDVSIADAYVADAAQIAAMKAIVD